MTHDDSTPRLGDALRHAGAGQPGGSHLGEDAIQPLQGPVEVDLDPTRRARHRLTSATQTKHDLVHFCLQKKEGKKERKKKERRQE